MRAIPSALICLIVLLGATGCASLRPEGDAVPVEAPSPRETGKVKVGAAYFDFTASLLRGGEFRLADEIGRKVVLLQFWGIRCGPCLQEFELLERLHRTYAERGLLVVGVNTDGLDSQRLSKAMGERQVGPGYPVVLDREFSAATHYTHWMVPVSVLIDRKGMVRAVHTGYRRELDAAIEAELVRVLGE